MEELTKTFYIDWKMMLAQLVNFAIVLFVLWKFAYKPILKALNERSEKIEKGIKDAEEAGKKLTETAEKEKEVIAEARQQAQMIIANAEENAKKNKEMIDDEAKKQSERILADAKVQIEEEKQKMLKEVKAEVGELIVAATEKIIGEKFDKEKDKELINSLIKS